MSTVFAAFAVFAAVYSPPVFKGLAAKTALLALSYVEGSGVEWAIFACPACPEGFEGSLSKGGYLFFQTNQPHRTNMRTWIPGNPSVATPSLATYDCRWPSRGRNAAGGGSPQAKRAGRRAAARPPVESSFLGRSLLERAARAGT